MYLPAFPIVFLSAYLYISLCNFVNKGVDNKQSSLISRQPRNFRQSPSNRSRVAPPVGFLGVRRHLSMAHFFYLPKEKCSKKTHSITRRTGSIIFTTVREISVRDMHNRFPAAVPYTSAVSTGCYQLEDHRWGDRSKDEMRWWLHEDVFG